VDAVLLTDHDTIEARRRGEEGWHGPVLICVGLEVSPWKRDHYLAFGIDDPVDHEGMSPEEVVAAVRDMGGFGFLAHPFSRGSERFGRGDQSWHALDDPNYTGLELWSLVTDVAEDLGSIPEALDFIARPHLVVEAPPPGNLAGYDRLCQTRPVVAIGGIDAHQIGIRVAGRVPVRLMSYARSFRFLRTHVLLERPPAGDGARDRDALYAALRAGRCYLALDALHPAHGFELWADGPGERVEMGAETAWDERMRIHARLPRAAQLTLVRDGEPVHRVHADALDLPAERPGVHRLEATLTAHGRERTWILSNPLYLRSG
jgi:hypothetical protein